jgi:hypothetical protein
MVTFKFEYDGVEIKSFSANMTKLEHTFPTCKVIYIPVVTLKVNLLLTHHMVNMVTLITFD